MTSTEALNTCGDINVGILQMLLMAEAFKNCSNFNENIIVGIHPLLMVALWSNIPSRYQVLGYI